MPDHRSTTLKLITHSTAHPIVIPERGEGICFSSLSTPYYCINPYNQLKTNKIKSFPKAPISYRQSSKLEIVRQSRSISPPLSAQPAYFQYFAKQYFQNEYFTEPPV
jgi:hypothetical protein